MACKPYHNASGYAGRQATSTASFPRPPAPPPPQPPLLPLPPAAQASPQYTFQPVNRPAPRSKKPRCDLAEPGPKKPAAPAPAGASAPIAVAAAPSKKRVAPATGLELEEALDWSWTETDSLCSVSPPPSSVPMPTSLLLTAAAPRKVLAACAVEMPGGVDVGATDELRRLLRL